MRHAPRISASTHSLRPSSASLRVVVVGGGFAGAVEVGIVAADESVETLRGDLVVNCLGHSADWSELGNPLVRALLDRGLARPHATGLGIDVDTASHGVIAAKGRPSGRLFAIGHPLRGAVWESSSIREIATQARTLGAMLAEIAEASRESGDTMRIVHRS